MGTYIAGMPGEVDLKKTYLSPPGNTLNHYRKYPSVFYGPGKVSAGLRHCSVSVDLLGQPLHSHGQTQNTLNPGSAARLRLGYMVARIYISLHPSVCEFSASWRRPALCASTGTRRVRRQQLPVLFRESQRSLVSTPRNSISSPLPLSSTFAEPA